MWPGIVALDRLFPVFRRFPNSLTTSERACCFSSLSRIRSRSLRLYSRSFAAPVSCSCASPSKPTKTTQTPTATQPPIVCQSRYPSGATMTKARHPKQPSLEFFDRDIPCKVNRLESGSTTLSASLRLCQTTQVNDKNGSFTFPQVSAKPSLTWERGGWRRSC